MTHDHSTTDRQSLNNAMRTAFRVNRVAVRPGTIRNTVNAAIRKAADREALNPEEHAPGDQAWALLGARDDQEAERDDGTPNDRSERCATG